MYAASFDYYRPKTVAEALSLLRKHKDSKLLAGGHSLLPAMKLRLASPRALVDIGGIKNLSGIKAKGKTIEIGALTTHAEIADSELVARSCPLLSETAALIGDMQVRNRGTVGGSLAHADPAADFPTAMLALDATMTARGARGDRKIAAGQFFTDLFETALEPNEILTSILVPVSGKGTGSAYLKHRHPASAYAVVGVAAVVEVKDGKCGRVALAVGGATTNPVRVAAAEKTLAGARPEASAFAAAAGKVAEALQSPLSDLYASGEFRVHLATVMAGRALAAAAERAKV
jgi:aerobic carbon-monoxide dehydrogenase medium subunit